MNANSHFFCWMGVYFAMEMLAIKSAKVKITRKLNLPIFISKYENIKKKTIIKLWKVRGCF